METPPGLELPQAAEKGLVGMMLHRGSVEAVVEEGRYTPVTPASQRSAQKLISTSCSSISWRCRLTRHRGRQKLHGCWADDVFAGPWIHVEAVMEEGRYTPVCWGSSSAATLL